MIISILVIESGFHHILTRTHASFDNGVLRDLKPSPERN